MGFLGYLFRGLGFGFGAGVGHEVAEEVIDAVKKPAPVNTANSVKVPPQEQPVQAQPNQEKTSEDMSNNKKEGK